MLSNNRKKEQGREEYALSANVMLVWRIFVMRPRPAESQKYIIAQRKNSLIRRVSFLRSVNTRVLWTVDSVKRSAWGQRYAKDTLCRGIHVLGDKSENW